jgi:HEAT repeat protein
MKSVLGYLLLLGAWSVLGCSSGPVKSVASLWDKKTDDPQVVHYKTPDERIGELRELAKGADRQSPVEQQQTSAQLAEALRVEEDSFLRAEMIRTLSVYPTETAGRMLTAALDDEDPDVRLAACQGWSRRGGPEAVQALGRALNSDTNLDVRLAAAEGLGQTGHPSATTPLSTALQDRDPALQLCAVRSLEQVTGEDFGNDVLAWQQHLGTTPAMGPPGEVPMPGDSSQQTASLWQRIKKAF